VLHFVQILLGFVQVAGEDTETSRKPQVLASLLQTESKIMDSRTALIAMLQRTYTRTKDTETRVRDRVAKKLCLNQFVETTAETKQIVDCDESTIGGRRGLCPKCAREFYDEMRRGTTAEAVSHENKLIQRGLILGRDELRDRNPNRKSLIRRKRA